MVTLQGEISEQFHGLEVGRRLRGEVVFDLSQVTRITSFGVREWLTMLRELYATRVTLARCAEPFLHQLSMIRSFAGTCRIASFFAPYVCSNCGTSFSALYDAVADRDAVHARLPVAADCPRCSSPAFFDDDPEVYLALDHHLVHDLEPPLAAAMAQLGELSGVPIRKAVVGRETWITLSTAMDASLRIARALDGIEGDVVFDLSALTGHTPEGVERFLRRVRSLGAEVRRVHLVGCPQALLAPLLEIQEGRHPDARLSVASARVNAHCRSPGCSAHPREREILVDLGVPSHVMAIRLGEAPPVGQDWCEGELDLGEALPLLQRTIDRTVKPVVPPAPTPSLAGQRTVVPSHLPDEHLASVIPIDRFAARKATAPRASTTLVPAPAAPTVQAQVTSTVHAAAEAARRPVSLPLPVLVVGIAALVSGVFVGTVGLLGGLLLVTLDGSGPLAMSGPTRPWAGAPAWVEQPFARTLTGVDLVGLARSTSLDEGLVDARSNMTETLLSHLSRSVMRRGGFELQLPSATALDDPDVRLAIAAFEAQVGAFASPTRIDGAVRQGPFGVRVAARYALSDDAWLAAAEHFADTEDFRGISVARAFPTLLPSLGEDASLVVVSTRPWMRTARPGDVITDVNGTPVDDLETFRAALDREWDDTAPGTWMHVGVRRGPRAQRRSIAFRKPAQ